MKKLVRKSWTKKMIKEQIAEFFSQRPNAAPGRWFFTACKNGKLRAEYNYQSHAAVAKLDTNYDNSKVEFLFSENYEAGEVYILYKDYQSEVESLI
jgi:hypothetical protein